MEKYIGALTLQDPSALGSFNPLFTTPAELITNKDFFTGRNYGPTDIQKLGGLEQILAPLSDNGIVPEQTLKAARGLNPLWEQAARMFPGLVSGNMDEMNDQRQPETYLRYAGVPIRMLTEAQKQATASSQYYDQRSQQRQAAAMQRALAAAGG
jgi:hypothetical protein